MNTRTLLNLHGEPGALIHPADCKGGASTMNQCYAKWRRADHLRAMLPATAIAGQFLQTFKGFLPSQRGGTLGIEATRQAIQNGTKRPAIEIHLTQRTIKARLINSSLNLILVTWSVVFFAGCASMETNKTPSLLAAAGFRVRTPQTAKQKELYAALPSNKLERATVKGKVIYVYKDEKAGVEYVGREPEHQRYHQLCREQHVAAAPEEQMNDFFTRSWAMQDYNG